MDFTRRDIEFVMSFLMLQGKLRDGDLTRFNHLKLGDIHLN